MRRSNCAFCDRGNLAGRMIQEGDQCLSFVSSPWFRWGHCLVAPRRHVTTVAELSPHESSALMIELGRLGRLLNQGYGSGIMQKYQPLQPENGIKVHHLHFHVFPRLAEEATLFPTPQPNDFTGFSMPSETEVAVLLDSLRRVGNR